MYKYTITVKEITEDNQVLYEATCRELPDAADYGETPSIAFNLMLETIQVWESEKKSPDLIEGADQPGR